MFLYINISPYCVVKSAQSCSIVVQYEVAIAGQFSYKNLKAIVLPHALEKLYQSKDA